MDVFERDGGATTADTVHTREEFRQIVADVQRAARDAAHRAAAARDRRALVRPDRRGDGHHGARASSRCWCARACRWPRPPRRACSPARRCALELGQVAEGLTRTSAPVRRHLRTCDRCTHLPPRAAQHQPRARGRVPDRPARRGQEVPLRQARRCRWRRRERRCGRGRRRSAAAAWRRGGGRRCRRGRGRDGSGAGGFISAGIGTVATKAAAGIAAAAIVTAGAVEVEACGPPIRSCRWRTRRWRRFGRLRRRSRRWSPRRRRPWTHATRHADKAKHDHHDHHDPDAPAPAPPVAAGQPTGTTDQSGSTVTLPAQPVGQPQGTDPG